MRLGFCFPHFARSSACWELSTGDFVLLPRFGLLLTTVGGWVGLTSSGLSFTYRDVLASDSSLTETVSDESSMFKFVGETPVLPNWLSFNVVISLGYGLGDVFEILKFSGTTSLAKLACCEVFLLWPECSHRFDRALVLA